MSAWKQFLASDLVVAPFLVNKGFTFTTSSFYTQSNGEFVGIERFLGVNIPWNVNYGSNSTTGDNQIEYQSLIYNSAKQLYYSNFLFSSSGDPAPLKVLLPGAGPSGSGDTFIGSGISGSGPLYDNFLQSTLTPQRYFPTASNSEVAVVSIPSKIYGEYISPYSFYLYYPDLDSTITDDGEGNLNISGSAVGEGYIGNIIYTHGIAVLTDSTQPDLAGYSLNDFVNENVTCSFSSSMVIYETQYKCTIQPSEFNATLNPSAQASGSTFEWTGSYFYQPGNGQLLDSLTGSYFAPYVTAVGLYDDAQNLIAVGKLSQPLPTSQTTDTTILVNLDF